MRGLFSLTLAVVCACQSVTVSDCSAGTSVFKIQSLSFSPSTPYAGMNGTLHVIYSVPAAVSEGIVTYSCILNGLHVYNEKYDLCTQTSCPINTGIHDDYSTSEIPSISGKLKCTINWEDMTNTQLLCIDTTLRLGLEPLYLRGIRPEVSKFRPNLISGTNLNEKITGPEPSPYEPYWPAVAELDCSTDSSSDSSSISNSLMD